MAKNDVRSAAEQLGDLLSNNDELDDETRAALEQLRAEVDHALVTESPSKKKTSDKEGYDAVQLAFGERRANLFSKAEKTHFEKNGGSEPKRWLAESRLSAEEAAALDADPRFREITGVSADADSEVTWI